MTTNNKQHEATDLEWAAFRFVSDEMTGSEQAEFEARLINEPAVALAVSRVLELTEAVDVATDRPAIVSATASNAAPQFESRRSSIVVVASLAACALVALVLVPANSTTATKRTLVTDTTPQPLEVIDTWLQVEPVPTTLVEPINIDEDEELDQLAMLEPDSLHADDEVVPDWMYAAFQDDDADGVSFE